MVYCGPETAMANAITTHELDTARGRPAANVPVVLERSGAAGAVGAFTEVGRGLTDADGRLKDLLGGGPVDAGVYRLRFDTAAYFRALGVDGFYPEVSVTFTIREAGAHHHVPLLLSPFGYATYRGS